VTGFLWSVLGTRYKRRKGKLHYVRIWEGRGIGVAGSVGVALAKLATVGNRLDTKMGHVI